MPKNNSNNALIGRRKRVIERLETQLKTGTGKSKWFKSKPLNEKDIERINKELTVLKTRI